MKQRGKRGFISGAALILAFILWTILIQTVDVQPVGVNGTNVGFAAVNTWFHRLTGVHMGIYTITDWLGLVPIAVCIGFGMLGLMQWIRRKSIAKVDMDILLLGGYYILVILGYLNGVTGVYQTPKGYYVDDQNVEAFDRQFPPKEKLKLQGQLFD